jgi:hypothetical protein
MQYVTSDPAQTIVSPNTGKVAGTILTVLIVGTVQVIGGVQPETLNDMVPFGPAPQITVAESLPGGGGG